MNLFTSSLLKLSLLLMYFENEKVLRCETLKTHTDTHTVTQQTHRYAQKETQLGSK